MISAADGPRGTDDRPEVAGFNVSKRLSVKFSLVFPGSRQPHDI
jgi:hypothetical protein